MRRTSLLCLAFMLVLLPVLCFAGSGDYQTHTNQDFNQTRPGDTFNPVAGGAINTRAGEFYPKSGPGLVAPRTGEYMPEVPGGIVNPGKGFNPAIPREDP